MVLFNYCTRILFSGEFTEGRGRESEVLGPPPEDFANLLKNGVQYCLLKVEPNSYFHTRLVILSSNSIYDIFFKFRVGRSGFAGPFPKSAQQVIVCNRKLVVLKCLSLLSLLS